MKKLLSLIFYTFILAVFPSLSLAATLSLSPSTGAFNKGCSFNVDIKLDTGGVQTDGTDAIVLFDQTKLTATNVTQGTIYAEYPGTNTDNETGKVTVSGVASISSAFSGTGTLATINFIVKDTAVSGATIVKFDFDPSGKTSDARCTQSGTNTCDSNVLKRGDSTELLTSVTNGNYTIGTGSCPAAGAPVVTLPATGQGAVSTPSAQIPVKEIPVKEIPVKTLPPAGSEQFTFMIAIVGSALTILGILGLVLL